MNAESQTCFYPGKPWLDTDGNRIQAHGGSIFYENGIYYWYGENKEHTDGKNGMWSSGVRMYSSRDLYDWKNEGIVLQPHSKDPNSPLHPTRILERPHLLKNPLTGLYVMWMKLSGTREDPTTWANARLGIATSSCITGPYTLQKSLFPCGMSAGDFDLWADTRDYKAYLVFERIHTEIIVADLTADYMDVTGMYSAHFWNPGPPLVREAPSLFCRDQWLYMLTSGTSGYNPNPTQAARTRLPHSTWQELGECCQNDLWRNSFAAQFSSVFKVPNKKDLYIALGDRWLASLGQEDVLRCNAEQRWYDGRFVNTSLADYVWLPVQFQSDGTPFLTWKDRWSLEEFEGL